MSVNIFQKVYKVPLEEIMPKFKTNPEKSYAVITDTLEGPKIVNFCSEDYTVIPNKEIFDPLNLALKKGYKGIEPSFTSYKDAVFSIAFNFTEKGQAMSKGDVIYPRMTIRNSYNGRIKYSIVWGIFRLICSNGMSVPVKGTTSKTLVLMHTPGAGDGIALEKTLENLEVFIKEFKDLVEPYELLKESTVGDIQYRIEEVVEATGFPARQTDMAIEQAKKEMAQLKQNANDWIVYNALNYQLNHNPEIAMLEHKKQALDNTVLQYLMAH